PYTTLFRSDRQPQRLPRRRPGLEDRGGLGASPRVDRHLRGSVLAAQVAVVRLLDARLPDRVARLVALALQPLVLLRGDLTHIAENLRGEGLVRVLAEVAVGESHSGKLVLVLVEVVDLLLLDPSLNDDRCQR